MDDQATKVGNAYPLQQGPNRPPLPARTRIPPEPQLTERQPLQPEHRRRRRRRHRRRRHRRRHRHRLMKYNRMQFNFLKNSALSTTMNLKTVKSICCIPYFLPPPPPEGAAAGAEPLSAAGAAAAEASGALAAGASCMTKVRSIDCSLMSLHKRALGLQLMMFAAA